MVDTIMTRWARWSRLVPVFYVPVLTACVVGYFGKLFWLFELASHFKTQYLVISLIFAAMFAFCRKRRWAQIALICALSNSLHIASFWIPATHSVSNRPASRSVRVLHSNLYMENHNHAALLELIGAENPDLIVVQEVTPEWAAALETIRGRYPEGIVIPDETAGGIGVLSRLPLQMVKDAGIERYNGPSLEVRLLVDGRIVHILTAHTRPPLSPSWLLARNLHFEAIVDRLRDMPAPKILIGDLNSTVWSPYFSASIGQTTMVDARRGFGLLATWPTWFPLMKIPIDQCFVSPDVEVLSLKAGSHIGSDHLPLIIDLRFR